MRIRNTIQKGLLICLYLAEKGKASAEVIAPALGEYPNQTRQVLQDLVAGNVLACDKDGIYRIRDNPTIKDVYEAFVPTEALRESEERHYKKGDTPQRAVLLHAKLVNEAMRPLFDKSVRGLYNDLHVQECNEMDAVPGGGTS